MFEWGRYLLYKNEKSNQIISKWIFNWYLINVYKCVNELKICEDNKLNNFKQTQKEKVNGINKWS